MPKRAKEKRVPRSYHESKPKPSPPPKQWLPPSLYGTVYPSWWAPDDATSDGWYHGPSSSDDDSLFGPWPHGTVKDVHALHDEMMFRRDNYRVAKEERRRKRELRQRKLEEILPPKYYSDEESSEDEFVGDDLEAGMAPGARAANSKSHSKKRASSKKGRGRKKVLPAKKGRKSLTQKQHVTYSSDEEEFELQFGPPKKKLPRPEISADELIQLDEGKPFTGVPWKSKKSTKNSTWSSKNSSKPTNAKKITAPRRVTGEFPPIHAPHNAEGRGSNSEISNHQWHTRRITGDFYVFSKNRKQCSTKEMAPEEQQAFLSQLAADSDGDSSLDRLLSAGLTAKPKKPSQKKASR